VAAALRPFLLGSVPSLVECDGCPPFPASICFSSSPHLRIARVAAALRPFEFGTAPSRFLEGLPAPFSICFSSSPHRRMARALMRVARSPAGGSRRRGGHLCGAAPRGRPGWRRPLYHRDAAVLLIFGLRLAVPQSASAAPRTFGSPGWRRPCVKRGRHRTRFFSVGRLAPAVRSLSSAPRIAGWPGPCSSSSRSGSPAALAADALLTGGPPPPFFFGLPQCVRPTGRCRPFGSA